MCTFIFKATFGVLEILIVAVASPFLLIHRFPFFIGIVFLLLAELAAEFIARPQNQEVVEGEKAEFACSVSKETYDVRWFRGNKEVESGDKYTVISEGKRRALIVKNCELKDEGGYVAHIGSVKASADLYVIGEMFMFFIPSSLS